MPYSLLVLKRGVIILELEDESIDALVGKVRHAFDILIKVQSKSHIPKEATDVCSILTYFSSEEINKHSQNLVKETKTLNFWTKVIVGTAVVMILVTITQIILTIAC